MKRWKLSESGQLKQIYRVIGDIADKVIGVTPRKKEREQGYLLVICLLEI